MRKYFSVSSFLFFLFVLSFGSFQTSAQITNRAVLDADGNGRTDLHLVTHSGLNTYWCWRYIGGPLSQIGYINFGASSGIEYLLGADFENNSTTEFTLYRTSSSFPNQSVFTAVGNFPFQQAPIAFGLNTDDPTVIGDYTGDGKADAAVFRCNPNDAVGTQCYWIYRRSDIGLIYWIPWGTVYAAGKADIAAPGDYDGDGKHDFAIRRPSNPADPNSPQVFYILRSSDGGAEYYTFGLASDKFVKGDFDGDGKTDLCAVRNTQTQGTQLQWFIRYSSNGGFASYVPFGLGKSGAIGDYLAPGDYTGDGRTDIAIWRRTAINEKTYFYILSSTPTQATFGNVLYEAVDACPFAPCEYPVAQYLVH